MTWGISDGYWINFLSGPNDILNYRQKLNTKCSLFGNISVFTFCNILPMLQYLLCGGACRKLISDSDFPGDLEYEQFDICKNFSLQFTFQSPIRFFKGYLSSQIKRKHQPSSILKQQHMRINNMVPTSQIYFATFRFSLADQNCCTIPISLAFSNILAGFLGSIDSVRFVSVGVLATGSC